jgi:hypothetical protein
MRPFGHEESRAERKLDAADTRLQEAWEHYAQHTLLYDINLLSASAHALLSPLRPSLDALDYLVLRNPVEAYDPKLGIFLTAGYQLLPEREIRYVLVTPSLSFLGTKLIGKHLIIDGHVGQMAGAWMIGSLTVNGRAGIDCGYDMIGVLTRGGGAVMPDFPPHVIGNAFGRWNIRPSKQAGFLNAITNPDGLSRNQLSDTITLNYYGREPL